MLMANELRIGNWVEDKKTWQKVQVEGIQFSGRVVVADSFYDDGKRGIEPTPILLTPEILEQCGLNRWGNEYSDKECFVMEYFKSSNAYHYTAGEGCKLGVGFKYLHELQNLYFALTGEELQVAL